MSYSALSIDYLTTSGKGLALVTMSKQFCCEHMAVTFICRGAVPHC